MILLWITVHPGHNDIKCRSQTQKSCIHNKNTLFNCTQDVQCRPFDFSRPLPFGILTWSEYTSRRPVRPKPLVALNNLPKHVPEHMRFNLVTATETNANHFILNFLSTAFSQYPQICTRHFFN